MFEQAVLPLLQGAFICDQTNSTVYQWLLEEHNQKSVDTYLQKIGRRLVKTKNENTFYSAWVSIGTEERNEVKNVFVHIKHTIAPVVSFLEMCMKHSRQDVAPVAGERVNYSSLLVAVSDNANALETLRSFANMGKEFATQDGSPKGMLDRVIGQMIKWGYLVENSKKQHTYIFTGKLDYFYEVLNFLNGEITSSSLDEDDNEDAIQVRLL